MNIRQKIHFSAGAFTLIELVISAALMAMILTATYACLSSALAGQKLLEPRADVTQAARVAMALITADLRAACPLSKDFNFLGMHRTIEDVDADNLDFATHNYKPTRPLEADFCEISYYVAKENDSPDYSLYRRRNPRIGLDPLQGGSRELIAQGLQGVVFEYYDGFEWYDAWGEINPDKKERKEKKTSLAPANLSGMPEAVRVTLRFDPDPRAGKARWKASAGEYARSQVENPEAPMVFQTTVRLNLAAASQSGFSKNSTGSSDQSGAQTPGQDGGQPQ
jgi:type II secretory pathway pseudopilin PulG